jgi:multidrug transporter EmrE-like cation transporter
MTNELLSNLFAVGNTLCFAVFLTIQKKYVFSPSAEMFSRWGARPVLGMAWIYLSGSLGMALAFAAGLGEHVAFLGFGHGRACTSDAFCHDNESPINASHPVWYCHGVVSNTTSNGTGVQGQCRMLSDTLVLRPATALPLVYAIVVASALCYGLISFANRHARTSTVAAFSPLQVVVTTILSYLVFGDTLSAAQAGGAVMVAAGLMAVVLSQTLRDRKNSRQQASETATAAESVAISPSGSERSPLLRHNHAVNADSPMPSL